MITISKKQMDAFARHSADRFVERTVLHLREAFPAEVESQGLDDQAVEDLTREGVDRSRAYGVVNEADVLRFVECMLLLGRDFDENKSYPWAGTTLRRSDLDGDGKMDLIDEYRIFGIERPV